MEKLINNYKRKIEKLEKSSNIDYERGNVALSAAKQMTAEYLKVAISDIERAIARQHEQSSANCATFDVSQQSKLLLAYHEWYLKTKGTITSSDPKTMVEMYLSQ